MARARPITNLDIQAPSAVNARIIVRERLADMYTYTQYVDNIANIQELHDLRIAAKRVRYTLEIFADYLPVACQRFVEELTTLQDELGELHDSEVMLALLRLSLHKEQQTTENEQPTEQPEKPKKALLSAQLARNIAHAQTPSGQAHDGLAHFLLSQEQRRLQCYAIFRQHWEQLQRRHFRDELLKVLARGEEREKD